MEEQIRQETVEITRESVMDLSLEAAEELRRKTKTDRNKTGMDSGWK